MIGRLTCSHLQRGWSLDILQKHLRKDLAFRGYRLDQRRLGANSCQQQHHNRCLQLQLCLHQRHASVLRQLEGQRCCPTDAGLAEEVKCCMNKTLTMFPISVDPRAKKKMISLQPPLVNSFAVMPTLVDWRTSTASGLAAAMPASKETRKELVFMFKVWRRLESRCIFECNCKKRRDGSNEGMK